MRKLSLLLVLVIAVSLCFCACNDTPPDYSDGDGNEELLSMENKKISSDNIEFSVVTVDDERQQSMVKTYKTEFLAEDFEAEYKKLKISGNAYVEESEKIASYPQKIMLPEYDLAALKSIMLSFYSEKYGPLDESTSFVCEPQFSAKTFTGKLVATYKIYLDKTLDEEGAECYKAAKQVTLTCDLYTYEVN